MADDGAPEVEVAAQLEREARQLLAGGHGSDSLELAVDQLHADQTNGEPLDSALRQLRAALDEHRNTAPGGGHE